MLLGKTIAGVAMHLTNDMDESARTGSRPDWWRSVFEASEDAQLICEKSGRILEINRRGGQLLSLSAAAEWTHASIFDVVSAPTAKRLAENFLRDANQPETLSAVTLLSGSGHVRLIVDLQ